MLAEWEMRDMHYAAFDATYAWSWSAGDDEDRGGACRHRRLFTFYSWNESAYPRQAMRLVGTTNHDANAWEGTNTSGTARCAKRRPYCPSSARVFR